MASSDFYQNLDLRYPEIAVLLNDVNRIGNRIGNFAIPILTPTMTTGSEVTIKKPAPPTSNIVNKNGNNGVAGYIESNFVSLKIPFHLFPIPPECERKNKNSGGCDCGSFHVEIEHTHHCAFINKNTVLKKGTRCIVIFLGGDINNIRVIGVCED